MRPELTEKAFRVWEPVIAQAVELYPSPLVWYPRPPQPRQSTCVARLRDAILSFARFNWTPTQINGLKWVQVKADFCVTEDDDGAVRLGPRTARTNPSIRPILSVINVVIPDSLTPEQRGNVFRCLCVLRSLETLPTVTISTFPSPAPSDLALLKTIAADYDVAILESHDCVTIV